ncbi:MAG: chromate transporter [Oscillospiraceae bacterium]
MMQLLILFATFLKIGLFTFGGGYASDSADRTGGILARLMSVTELTDFIAISNPRPARLP